ncbi:hypothetical protein [Chitinophaga nivalis]|uniref:Phage head morphogenesis domain-containing protein n=1 Tax=Chitinophaga nivalis TaxID=2991709 RepID=A0ABT3IIL3_9BACT|nr:hypothetical protein [Chitinophaga nivalis]MCW3466503.1 hypothetical protein [Chitinophaga nivalis]MCW3483806.1 hypothetical protein [Chitinophaga nivalis]
MATPSEIIKQINDLVEKSAETFNGKVPLLQQKVFDEISGLLKGLVLKNGRIQANISNVRLIGMIARKLQKLILDEGYKSDVTEYMKAFNGISSLQNDYFKALNKRYKPTKMLDAVKKESINSTLDALTESGLKSNVIEPIKKILTQSITTGGSYKQLQETLRVNLTDDDTGDGIMSKYLKTYTITSVSQYSRNYSQTASQGLNFQWYRYTGSNIKTTRCFCLAMTEKEFFHVSEIPALLAGDFPEYKARHCAVYEKTGLPEGMINGTNSSNFITLAGGWNCQHGIYPVPDAFVPKELRNKYV